MKVPIPFDASASTLRRMRVTIGVNFNWILDAQVQQRARYQRFKEFAIGNGAAAMQINDLQRRVDRAVCTSQRMPKGFGQVRCLHHRRHPALPGDIAAHDINHAARDALGGRIMRANEHLGSTNRDVQIARQLAQAVEIGIVERGSSNQ